MLKPLIAPLVAVLNLAFTANGYRLLSKGGYGSGFAFGYGVFASELPLQSLGVQLTATAALSRRLPPRLRQFCWLLTLLSGLGLLGLRQLGHRANEPLTAALDAGLGPERRRESGDLWKRPAPGGATAKKPGAARMSRVYRTTHTTATSVTGSSGRATTSISGGGPTSTAMGGRRCCCRFPAVRGWWETNADRHIR